MIKDLIFSIEECNALTHLARVSKMDYWFDIDESGNARDMEDGGRTMSNYSAVQQLMDGATDYDLTFLTHKEKDVIILLLFKMIEMRTNKK